MNLCVRQKIKNPNYKGKWKTPWIDNPGKFVYLATLCGSILSLI